MTDRSYSGYGRFVRIALIVSALGALIGVAGLIIDVQTALRVYLSAVVGWIAVPIGCITVLMMMQLISGRWRWELGDAIEAGSRTMPLAALLFLPVLIGVQEIFPWAAPSVIETGFKAIYFNTWFFVGRSLAYLAIWIVLSLTVRWVDRPRRAVCAVGLILYGIIGTLSGVDWTMSVEPEFYSTIFGLIIIARQFLEAFAVAVVIKMLVARSGKFSVASGLLISGILFWGYTHCMQFIVIWTGDLPKEIAWYVVRSSGPWRIVLWLIALGGGIVPFFLLLRSAWRRIPERLGGLALVVFGVMLIEAFWLTLPSLPESPSGSVFTAIVSVGMTAALGGVLIANFFSHFARTQRSPAQAGGGNG